MVDNETLPTLEPDLGNASVGKRPGAISKRVLLRVTNSPEQLRYKNEFLFSEIGVGQRCDYCR